MNTQHSKHDSHSPRAPEDRSLGSLVRDLMLEMVSLFRNEAALARAEINEKMTQVQGGLVSFILAIVLLFVGLVGLLLAGIYGLSQIWPMWLSALVIGGGVFVIGLIALAKAYSNLKASNLKLDHTKRELQKEASFARDQTL